MRDEEDIDERRWRLLRSKLNEENLKSTLSFLRSRGFDPILIKGWAIGREYPEPAEREWRDFDFCVSAAEYDECFRVLSEAQLKGVNFDLHRELRHLDSVEWDDLFANSRIVKLDDVDVRILRPEDHLRVLCNHWLTDGGARRERLDDIRHLLENHRTDFDWERCLGVVGPTRRGWVVCAVAAAAKYAGLDTSWMPISAETQKLPTWMVRELEREWNDDTVLEPLHVKILEPRAFFRQLRKRFPPNSVQATIEVGGRFDDGSRVPYQLKNVLMRLGPSVRRIGRALGISLSK